MLASTTAAVWRALALACAVRAGLLAVPRVAPLLRAALVFAAAVFRAETEVAVAFERAALFADEPAFCDAVRTRAGAPRVDVVRFEALAVLRREVMKSRPFGTAITDSRG